jgi:hypothetical protein
LEFEAPAADAEPNAKPALTFKGVVFNEMKGARSDNATLFVQHLQVRASPSLPSLSLPTIYHHLLSLCCVVV